LPRHPTSPLFPYTTLFRSNFAKQPAPSCERRRILLPRGDKTMRILVTGATGFLGKFLCPFLEEKGHEVLRLSSSVCDLTEAGALDRKSTRLNSSHVKISYA